MVDLVDGGSVVNWAYPVHFFVIKLSIQISVTGDRLEVFSRKLCLHLYQTKGCDIHVNQEKRNL